MEAGVLGGERPALPALRIRFPLGHDFWDLHEGPRLGANVPF